MRIRRFVEVVRHLFRNNYIFNMFAKIYSVLVGLVSSAFLTRYFGLELRGEYAYINQVVMIIAIVFNLGMNQSYSYFYKKHKGGIYAKYINLFFAQLLVNLVIFGILSYCFRQSIYLYVAILAPFTIVTQNFQGCMAVENIELKIGLNIGVVTFKAVAYTLIFFICPQRLWIPIVVTVIIDIITLAVYVIKTKIPPRPFRLEKRVITETIRYSWLPMLSSLMLTLNYSVDIIFLKHMSTPAQLSLYSVAAAIINYVWLVPDTFKEVLISRVARSTSVDSVVLSIKLSLAILAAVLAAFVLVGKYFIWFLYGGDFVGAYLVTVILMVGSLSMVLFKVIGVLYLAEGRRNFYFFSLLISVIVNISLIYVTVPALGMYGTAISSMISYSVCGFTFLIHFSRTHKIPMGSVLLLRKAEMSAVLERLKRGRNTGD